MYNENSISKILRVIGIIIIGLGILMLFIGFSDEDLLASGIIGLPLCIISGMTFIGFSEIICLLQQNGDNQEKIINQLKELKESVSSLRDKPKTNKNKDELDEMLRLNLITQEEYDAYFK